MMNRIDKLFEKQDKSLIVFISAGDPDIETTVRLVPELEKAGADLVELGVPFSDPLADGPVIQEAGLRALENGTTLKKIVKAVKEIRKVSNIPIVLFSAYNPIYRYGVEKLVKDAADAGVDGFLVPELPPEDSDELKVPADKAGMKTVFLVAPTTQDERAKMILKKTGGFVYYISTTGVTGTRETLSDSIRKKVLSLKKLSDKPVAVGFGISKPEHVKEVGEYADAVVVGSAVVRLIAKHGKSEKMYKEVGNFVKSLKSAL